MCEPLKMSPVKVSGRDAEETQSAIHAILFEGRARISPLLAFPPHPPYFHPRTLGCWYASIRAFVRVAYKYVYVCLCVCRGA